MDPFDQNPFCNEIFDGPSTKGDSLCQLPEVKIFIKRVHLVSWRTNEFGFISPSSAFTDAAADGLSKGLQTLLHPSICC